jgi:hypothetical protein
MLIDKGRQPLFFTIRCPPATRGDRVIGVDSGLPGTETSRSKISGLEQA